MSDENTKTVRIQRPARIRTDEKGRSVWAGPVETVELELMSTVALRNVLKSQDESAKKAIERAAESGDEGVLARDIATGLFEIVSDADLQSVLENDPNLPKQEKSTDVIYEPACESEKSIEDLTLVSTQALRRHLGKEEEEEPVITDAKETGFEPYNSG
ncbi:MAG: hypothetical protein ACE5OQ_10540 [Woeseia sp.]